LCGPWFGASGWSGSGGALSCASNRTIESPKHVASAAPYVSEDLVFMIFLSVQLVRFAYQAKWFAPISKTGLPSCPFVLFS
jgi:hypothetical protein